MDKFEELVAKAKASIDKVITTEMPQEQIAQISALKDDIDALAKSHNELADDALKTKEKYIELVKGYGTSKTPDPVEGATPKSLEEIAGEIVSKRQTH